MICKGQTLSIRLLSGDSVKTTIVDDSGRTELIKKYNGVRVEGITIPGTPRTFRLANGKILVECYDKGAIIFDSEKDLKKAQGIAFIKTLVDRHKRNISYKFPIDYAQAQSLAANSVKLDDYISDYPELYKFKVYRFNSLFLYVDDLYKSATVYPDIKSLVSEHPELHTIAYGDEESIEIRFVHGEPYLDFCPNEHRVWSKDVPVLIAAHKLHAIDTNIHISDFRGILYRSENGYYMVVDDLAQKGKNGQPISITTATVFEALPEVRDAVTHYQSYLGKPVQHEHFYKSISDRYGDIFGKSVPQLLESLPSLLNVNKEDITFDSAGMSIIDQAINWRYDDYEHFDKWFPAVLAFYGECIIKNKKDARWVVRTETKDNIKVPHVVLPGDVDAFNSNQFYKYLFEYPTPLAVAGDWDRIMK